MSVIYPGDGTQPTPTSGAARRVAIQSSTDATPIVIQANGHLFNTGDTVEVEGHQTNTHANGLWAITVTGPNNFALNSSTATGAGPGAGGYAIDYEIQPALQLPSDSELVDASTSNPPLEALTDCRPFFYRLAGLYRVYDLYQKVRSSPNDNTWSATTLSSSFATLTGTTSLPAFGVPFPVVDAGDILLIEMTTSIEVPTAAQVAGVCMAIDYGRTGTYLQLQESLQWFGTNGIAGLNLRAIAFAPISADFDLALMGLSSSGAACVCNLRGSFTLTVMHLRGN